MISPGKRRYIGAEYPGAAVFEALVAKQFNLATAKDPDSFLKAVESWASSSAYEKWLAAYKNNTGNFLDHPVWGADRHLGGGKHLYGAMDDRYATNAARVFVPGGLDAARDVEGKRCLVVGAWDGTEGLLLRAMGAVEVDALDEVEAFTDMTMAQYVTWSVPGAVCNGSLYEVPITDWWQRYDLVYVPGVLYHLTDLPLAMTILWAITKPGGKVAFESIADSGPFAWARYIGPSLAGWNWWSPTDKCYNALLRDCGFPDGHMVEFSGGRGWWVGTRGDKALSVSNGAAGFSRPEVLEQIRSKNV